ncbi:hypothetical protein [Metabacillus iocasae]|uniref:Uncharacterized protein n=1 Tax=Priestia iocasae TaxID=2291674 RepID=A0ABS2QXS1_9BACI|nr:hypothetical protein [Metabacillus iocasae]MBM7704278.1 hypothetical protein [Metabacillus iocasae]
MASQNTKRFMRPALLIIPIFFAVCATISTTTVFIVEGAKGNLPSLWVFVIIVIPFYLFVWIGLRLRKKLK